MGMGLGRRRLYPPIPYPLPSLPRGPETDEARVRLVSTATQTRRKFAFEMGRPDTKRTRWIRAVARWAASFVHFTSNGRGRIGWGHAVKLASTGDGGARLRRQIIVALGAEHAVRSVTSTMMVLALACPTNVAWISHFLLRSLFFSFLFFVRHLQVA